MTSPLIQKLRDAKSGSRELDAAIHDAMLPPIEEREGFEKCYRRAEGAAVVSYWEYASGRIGHSTSLLFPEYSTSLDAIIGLIEEKLPGWNWIRAFNMALGNGFHMCLVPDLNITGDTDPGVPLPRLTYSDHADTVLALNIALLEAIEQLNEIDRHKRALSALEGEANG